MLFDYNNTAIIWQDLSIYSTISPKNWFLDADIIRYVFYSTLYIPLAGNWFYMNIQNWLLHMNSLEDSINLDVLITILKFYLAYQCRKIGF